jgi:pimeloyl-ACP methyl ester carboxylesterase
VNGAFACETARHRRVEVRGLDLHLLEWGLTGRSGILLLHGGAAHAHWFDAVATPLADDRHVVGVLDRLGWRSAVLVGHSMGGHNAIASAAWYPERARALVIVDSRPAIPAERLAWMRERGERPPRRHASLEAAVAAFRLVPPDTSACPALLAHLARESVAWRDGTVGARFDPAGYAARKPVDAWPLLPRITTPTLVLRGERSPILPRPMAERLRAEIPDARLVEIAEAYHHLILDRPEAFVRALREFLDDLDAGAGGGAHAPTRPGAP